MCACSSPWHDRLHVLCRALQAELPDLLEALDGSSTASVPEALLRDIDEVNSIGGTQHLREVGMYAEKLRVFGHLIQSVFTAPCLSDSRTIPLSLLFGCIDQELLLRG